MKAKVPSARTLARYGLTRAEWKRILKGQAGTCSICHSVPASGRLVTDHEHIPGWKAMPAAQRAKYVRGILCGMCNYRMLPRGATPEKLRAAADYLEAYLSRRVQ